jgi:ABC-type phosphate transport system substrate-binding protein
VALVLSAAACDDAPLQGAGQSVEGVRLRGVGATVPKALFAKWSQEYARVDPRVTFEYEAAGSGAGVRVAKDGRRACS